VLKLPGKWLGTSVLNDKPKVGFSALRIVGLGGQLENNLVTAVKLHKGTEQVFFVSGLDFLFRGRVW
jgi:hypothetical protein